MHYKIKHTAKGNTKQKPRKSAAERRPLPIVRTLDGQRHRPPFTPASPALSAPLDRLVAYCDTLLATGTPVAADPDNPDIASLTITAVEAGIPVSILHDPAGEPRRYLDLAVAEVGLARVETAPAPEDPARSLSIGELTGLYIHAILGGDRTDEVPIAETLHRARSLLDTAASLAGGRDRPAALALDCLRLAITARKVPGGKAALAVVDEVRALLADYQCRITTPDGRAHYGTFAIRLAMAIAVAGLSQGEVARTVGMSAGTLNHWIRGDRIPDRRHETLIAGIERLLDLPEGALVASIVRRRAGQGRLPEHLWPARLRGAKKMRLRAKIKRWLPDLSGCDDQTIRALILAAEKAWRMATADGHRQLEKRRANAVAHTAPGFEGDLERYRAWATTVDADGGCRDRDPLRPRSAKTYMGYLRQIGSYRMSPACPEDLRMSPDELRLPHVVAVPVLRAWFAARRAVLRNGEKENRSQVDRLHCLAGVLEYLADHSDLMAILRTENADLLPRDGACSDREVGERLSAAIDGLRRTLRRSTMKPKTGAERYAMILQLGRPLDVVDTMLTSLDAEISGLEFGSPAWAKAVGDRLLVAVLGQTGLRAETVGKIRYAGAARHMHFKDGHWHLDMPADLFKSDKATVFQDGRYRRDLIDDGRINRYVDVYVRCARPVLLGGRTSSFLFVTRRKGEVIGLPASIVRQTVVAISRRTIGATAPEGQRIDGLEHLSPHTFRDILATSVLKSTLDLTMTADAIHVTEKTAREHYVRWLPSDRVGLLRQTLSSLIPRPDTVSSS